MHLSHFVNTMGQYLRKRFGEPVHKISVDAGFTCPNRDGSIGRGGCTFCNNTSFSPNSRKSIPLETQISNGREVITRRLGAKLYLAYFQAYTNTYDSIEVLKARYERALAQDDVIGLCVGTRPDCVSQAVLELLASYRDQGYEIWLELGLQSSFDSTLERVNRGHGFADYLRTAKAARALGIPVCTHLIVGLPGESYRHAEITLQRVIDAGCDGLKLHPLHVVKGTRLANEWRRGEYAPMEIQDYIKQVAQLITLTPKEIVYHRLTGTASAKILLAPQWCSGKWRVMNGIAEALMQDHACQGSAL